MSRSILSHSIAGSKRRRRSGRILGLLALLLVLALLVAAAAGYFELRRSLPRTRGELALSGLSAPVSVYRDGRGVPHIVATSAHDLFMAQGFVAAQDRLWQMDLTRRAVAGRLAEVLGEDLLDVDRFFRSLGLARAAEASLPALSAEALAAAEAYAAGVNAFIAMAVAERRLPLEFRLLGYEPEPWTPLDTAGIGKYMAYDLGGNFTSEVWRFQLAQKVGIEAVLDLAPVYPAEGPVIAREWLALNIDLQSLPDALLEHREGVGSNNWVLAGSRTASGAPMLANDPHLGISLPAIWYQTHLTSDDGWDTIGVSFPGVPGLVIGHNAHIAWGVTNLGPDVQDLYVEVPNPLNPRQFLYRDRWEPAEVVIEEIHVKGRDEPERHEVLITRHGPIITPVAGSKESRPSAALSLQWTALGPTTELDAVLRFGTATDWAEFRAALRYFLAPAQNFVFAARDGTIAYRGNGLIPIRSRGEGLFPVPGWTGEYAWEGYVPWEELPEAVSPERGYLVTANARVVGDEYPYFLAHEWAPPYRHRRIEEVLAGARNWTIDDMKALQTDAVNLQAAELLPLLLPAAAQGLQQKGGPDGLAEKALELLASWDYEDDPDATAPTIYHTWYNELQRAIFFDEMGEDLWRRMPAATLVTDRLVQEAAAGRVSPWFNDTTTSDNEGLAEIAARSLQAALERLEAELGSRPERWRWGRLHHIAFAHAMDGVPLLGRWLRVGPHPIPGGPNTVWAASYARPKGEFAVTDSAPWRQVVDLGDRAGRAFDIVTLGQSGHRLSRHYADQARLWIEGDYAPMLTAAEDYRSGQRLILVPR